MTVDDDFDIPNTGAVFTFGKSRFGDNTPSKFWIKNDMILDIACGDEHTAVLTESGRVFTIGSNDMGQLGLGSTKPVNKPSCVKGLKPEKAVRIACGTAHTLVACESGGVYGWGENSEGQLGIGDLNDKYSPVLIITFDIPVVALSAGSQHSTLLTDNGEVYIWGSNREGQLGLDGTNHITPTLLQLPHTIMDITAGYFHTLAITDSGEVYSWGEADHGKLGLPQNQLDGHNYPQKVPLPEKVVQVAAGATHTLFLSESGGIYSCGLGSNGELGQGQGEMECWLPQHILETNTQPVISISAGYNHNAAITGDGLVLTWGCGRHGKLCHGEDNFTSQFTPVIVRRLRHINALLVGCGGCHTMVVGCHGTDIDEANTSSYKHTTLLQRNNIQSVLGGVKSMSVVGIKHTVLPTIPNNEDSTQNNHHMQDSGSGGGESSEVNGSTGLPEDNLPQNNDDDNEEDEEEELKKEEGVKKKAGGFSGLFRGFRKKKVLDKVDDCDKVDGSDDNDDVHSTNSMNDDMIGYIDEGSSATDGSHVIDSTPLSSPTGTSTSQNKQSKTCVVL